MSDESKKRMTWPQWMATLLVALLLLCAGYGGAYWLSLRHEPYRIDPVADYRLPGPWRFSGKAHHCVRLFFGPANDIDRLLRPNHWNGSEYRVVDPDFVIE